MNKNTTVNFSNNEIKIIRSNRKSIGLEVKENGEVICRAPYFLSQRTVEGFLFEKRDWIENAVKKVEERKLLSESRPQFSESEIQHLYSLAKSIIPAKVQYYARIIGVSYGRISIRYQKTRWGSCSSDHNLNFNCMLMTMPEDIVDYVVVHELCHIKQMNHSPAFWHEVEKIIPDYKERRKYLKQQKTR